MLLQNQYKNKMHGEFINLFHKLNLPLHFNFKGNKQTDIFDNSLSKIQEISKRFYQGIKRIEMDFLARVKKNSKEKYTS